MPEAQTIPGPLTVASRLTKGGGEARVNPVVYTASGAINTAITGQHKLQGAGPFAMTLAPPTAAQEGFVLTIYNDTIAAHTVTATGGFGGGGGASDQALFGAMKSALTIMAVNLHWTVLSPGQTVVS
jgi:hypothetical protein